MLSIQMMFLMSPAVTSGSVRKRTDENIQRRGQHSNHSPPSQNHSRGQSRLFHTQRRFRGAVSSHLPSHHRIVIASDSIIIVMASSLSSTPKSTSHSTFSLVHQVMSLLKNPMMLMMGVTLGMTWVIPKIMGSLDEEALEELQGGANRQQLEEPPTWEPPTLRPTITNH